MTRLHLIFLVSLIAFLGSLTATFASANDRDFRLRGYVDATQQHELPFRIPRVGVNADLTQYTPQELTITLERMHVANVTWIRQFVHPADVMLAPDEFDWTTWDAIFAALDNYTELQIIPVLFGSPAWARDSQAAEPSTAPPRDITAFAAFAAAFAMRFGGSVDVYQIWDEPNLASAWGGLDPRPADYAALLSETAAAIRAGDPDAQILAAALAPTFETGTRNINEMLYLTELYRLGAIDNIDGIAAKPYGFNFPPDDRTIDDNVLNFSRVVALREIMVAYGDATKPLWISEFGWNTLPSSWTGRPSIWGQVTPQQQTDYTRAAFARAEREWTWLGGMILAYWQPNAPDDDPVRGFAIIDPDNIPTPLYDALTSLPQPTNAANGLYPAANIYADYFGVWTFGDLGADIGWIQDSRLAFRFQGRDAALLLRQGGYEAYLYPTVDDDPANATPRDASGNAFINLKSDTLETELELVTVARGLADTDHVLRAAADRGWDQWALVGYGVSSGDLSAPYQAQMAIALLSTLITGATALVTASSIDWSPFVQRTTLLWRGASAAAQITFSIITSLVLLIGMFITWDDSTPSFFRREPVQIGIAIITAGVIYLEPGLIITLIASAVLFVLFYHRVDLALILTILYAPFFLFPVELLLFAFPMSELIILIAGGSWFVRQLAEFARARRDGSIYAFFSLRLLFSRLHALDWAMLAWVALGVLSLSWTVYSDVAITELRTLILEPVLFYIILRSFKPNLKLLLRLVDTLIIAGVIVSILGIFMFVTGAGAGVITAEEGVARLASVYGSPNNVALFLGRCIPFALAFTLLNLDRRRRQLAAAASLLLIVTVLLTLSAGGIFIGVPAAVIAILLWIYGRRAVVFIAGLIGVGALGALIALQSARFARLLNFSEGTNFFRIRVWQSAIQVITDHPITGLGLDQFLFAFRGRYMLPDAWQEPELSHPHNIILDFWTRLGFFGVLLLVFTQFAFWRTALHVYKRLNDPLPRALIIGTMGAMVNLLAHGMVDNSIFLNDLTYVFALMIGLMASIGTSELLTPPSK